MKKIYVILFLSLFFISCAVTKNEVDLSISPMKKSIDEAIYKVKPALVRIHVVGTNYQDGREFKQESAGSGVIIDKEGYVVTNHHVAGKAVTLICTMSNKEEIEAELIGTDPLADIAVIKLKPKKDRVFPFASFGDSDKVKVGDDILAMGSPLALSQSVTMGIISNMEMVMPQLFWPFNNFEIEGENVGTIVRWIGHDAPIYGGNSGGPLVNMHGEIIGINEIGMGLSGAIPGNLAKEVASQIIKNKEVTRSWLGLEVQPLLKSNDEKGILVSGVTDESPASIAKILPGDIIVKLNNKEINVNFAEELPLFNLFVMSLPIGNKVEVVLLRNNSEMKLDIIPAKREQIRPPVQEIKTWGITASNLSMILAQEMKRKNKDGVLINNIRPGGPCDEAKPAIRSHDVIVKLNNEPVKNLDDFFKITEKIINSDSVEKAVLVNFDRRSEKYMTVVKLQKKDWEDKGLESKKAWLGISFQVLTKSLTEALNIGNKTGVCVTQVFPGSPAEKADLQVGDLITELDGEPISCSEPQEMEVFPSLIRQYKIGSTVEFTVLRDKKENKIKVVLGQTPPSEKEMKKYINKDFEFAVRDITFMDKVNKTTTDNIGVLVDSVEGGSWAALAHLAVGDIILEANGAVINNVDSLEKIMLELKNKNQLSAVFKVQRGIHTIYIELEAKGGKYDSIQK